jgi:hypothetical protein
MGKRRISKAEGETALLRGDESVAVRYILQQIEEKLPGKSVELRVPPHGAIQCVAGLNHRRGTPPNLVEISSHVFLKLASGQSSWQTEVENGQVIASGELSAALAKIFPLSGD